MSLSSCLDSKVHFLKKLFSFFFKYLFIYSFCLFILFYFGCVGSSLLHAGFLFSCREWGLLFVVVHGLLIAAASLVAEHEL